jgi:hypothetical protein
MAITPPNIASSSGDSTGMFSGNNGLIIFLLLLVILAFLGINMLIISGNALSELAKIFGPTFRKVASMLGYSTGHLVNTTADLSADTAKLGIDIAEGTAQSVGNLLKSASTGGMDENLRRDLEKTLTSPKCPTNTKTPSPSQSSGNIHRSISAKKAGWCLIGEDDGARGCIRVEEHDKCMSGQIFPSRESCMAPDTTQP